TGYRLAQVSSEPRELACSGRVLPLSTQAPRMEPHARKEPENVLTPGTAIHTILPFGGGGHIKSHWTALASTSGILARCRACQLCAFLLTVFPSPATACPSFVRRTGRERFRWRSSVGRAADL